jgi:hypothetical protein
MLASCQHARAQNTNTNQAASTEVNPSTPPRKLTTVAPPAGGELWTFDDGRAGRGPAGWTPGESNGAGTPATWAIIARTDAPSSPNAYGVTASANYGHTFNVALADGTGYRDVDLTVAVLAMAGSEDQGGGPVWRAADADNYYITRWNPLEKNFRLYFVKDGRRKQLATAEATDDTTHWHTIRVVHRVSHIECYLDGEKLLEVDDTTFQAAGQVGLWTKADAATLFDDLRVEPAR